MLHQAFSHEKDQQYLSGSDDMFELRPRLDPVLSSASSTLAPEWVMHNVYVRGGAMITRATMDVSL